MSNAVKYKKSNHLHTVEHGGTINISKYVNNFLSTNPTALILSSLVSEFRQRIQIFFFFFFFFFFFLGGGGGRGRQGIRAPSFAPIFY